MGLTQFRSIAIRIVPLLTIPILLLACEDQSAPDGPPDAILDARNPTDGPEEVDEKAEAGGADGGGAEAGTDGAGGEAGGIQSRDAAGDSSAVLSVVVTPHNPVIYPGTSIPMQARAQHADGSVALLDDQVQWSSARPQVATVSATGVVLAVSVGETSISATYQGVVGSTLLTVGTPATVGIRVLPGSATITRGMSAAFRAHMLFSNDTWQDITEAAIWTVEHPVIASVSNQDGQRGLVQALSAGPTQVRAALLDMTGSANVTVTAP